MNPDLESDAKNEVETLFFDASVTRDRRMVLTFAWAPVSEYRVLKKQFTITMLG